MPRIIRDTTVSPQRQLLKTNFPTEATSPNLLTLQRQFDANNAITGFDVIIGNPQEVLEGFATNTIADFTAALSDNDKIYFKAGSHTLTGSFTFGPTLTNVKITFDPEAVIVKASTFVWTFSGTKFEIFGGRFSGFDPDDIDISGAQNWFRIVEGSESVFDVQAGATGSRVDSVNSGIRWDLMLIDSTAGEMQMDGTTDATSDSTGTLRIPLGGLGVGLDLWVGAAINVDGTDISFTGADADRTISFSSTTSLVYTDLGAFTTTGPDLTLNNPLRIAIDSGAVPGTISDNTGLVISNTSDPGDNVNLSLISGANGNSIINFGDTALENPHFIDYDHLSGIMAFSAETRFAMNSRLDIDMDGGAFPDIDGDTALVLNNSGVIQDVNLSLISYSTSGTSRIQFGDSFDENIGMIEYSNQFNWMDFTVNVDKVARFSATANQTLQLHPDSDEDTGIFFGTVASLLYDQSAGFGPAGDFTFNKSLRIAIDSGALPSIKSWTGLVVSNTSVDSDLAAISIISGATSSLGTSSLYFGDFDDEVIGSLDYFHTTDTLSMTVNSDRVVDFAASTTQTIRLHADSNQDGGIMFASDSSLVWVDAGDFNVSGIGNYRLNKAIDIALDANTLPQNISASTALVVSNAGTNTDSVGISLISGTIGQATLNFGDTGSETVGAINYDHPNAQMVMFVETAPVVTFKDSTTATISLHIGGNADGGIQFATDASILWDEIHALNADGAFTCSKDWYPTTDNTLDLGQNGVAEVQNIQTIAASTMVTGDSFNLESPTVVYYVWYNKDAGGGDPAPGGVGIEVTIAAADTADQVATVTRAAIDAVGSSLVFNVTGTINNVTITNLATGAVVDATDVSTQFSFDTPTTQGIDNRHYANMWATIFHGEATSALYSDLAERYTNINDNLPEGTLVSVTKTEGFDVQITQSPLDFNVLGVVSLNPAFMMNSDGKGQFIARIGMVPVRVIGKVFKGDYLVASHTPGVARVGYGTEHQYKFGFALETNTNIEEKLVKCVM